MLWTVFVLPYTDTDVDVKNVLNKEKVTGLSFWRSHGYMNTQQNGSNNSSLPFI